MYSTTLSGDRAIEIAKEHKATNEADGTDDPLFMYLAFQVRGSPVFPPPLPLYDETARRYK